MEVLTIADRNAPFSNTAPVKSAMDLGKLEMIEASIANLYRGAKGDDYHLGKRHVSPFQRSLIVNSRAEKFRPFTSPHLKLLEYGTGDGWNIAGVVAEEISGYDVGGAEVVSGRSGNIRIWRDSEAIPKDYYDVCLCHHVLEHVPFPIYTLVEIREKLKKGGLLFLCVPYEKDRASHSYRSGDRDHHIYTWSPQSLGNLAEMAGYTVAAMRVRRFGYDRAASRLVECMGEQKWLFKPLRFAMQLVRPKYEIQCLLENSGRQHLRAA